MKQLWVVAVKKDCLWIKWINNYCIKNRPLESAAIPKSVAWVVRKILQTGDLLMQQGQLQGDLHTRLASLHSEGYFEIHKAYLLHIPQYTKVARKSVVLHTHLHPRFKFMVSCPE